MDISQIQKLVANFRLAIEKCDRKSLSIGLQDFPAGACGDATLILGQFLTDCGFHGFNYVLGEFSTDSKEKQRQSHAWLQSDCVVVDITADQFDDVNDKVIVRYKSAWHELLNGRIQHPADINILDDYTCGVLTGDYMEIMHHYNDDPSDH